MTPIRLCPTPIAKCSTIVMTKFKASAKGSLPTLPLPSIMKIASIFLPLVKQCVGDDVVVVAAGNTEKAIQRIESFILI